MNDVIAPGSQRPAKSKDILAVTSFICGVSSLFCFCCVCQLPLPVIGLITGSFGLKSSYPKLAKIGIALSLLGLIVTLLWYLLVMLGQVNNPGFLKWESSFPYGGTTTAPVD